MKKLLTILLLLTAYFSNGQGTITYVPYSSAGVQFKYVIQDSGSNVPFRELALRRGSTRPGSIICNMVDSLLYYYNGIRFVPIGSGIVGRGVDSITVVNGVLCQWVGGVSTCYNIGRNDTLFAQRPIFFDSTTIPGSTIIKFLQKNGIVSGGIVTVDSCRSLDIPATTISLNYVQYFSVATRLTVPPSDPSNPRIDEVIDSLGYIILRIGTPSATPIGKPYNSATEWLLANYEFAAGASCLDVNQIIVWDENLGSPTEFTLTLAGTISANGNNTDNPQHLTKAIFVSTYANGSSLIFTKSSTLTAQATEILKFWVYLNGAFSNQFIIQITNGGSPVGNPVAFNAGFGFNPNDSNEYQPVLIPFSAFSLTNQTFDGFTLTFFGNDLSGAKGLYIDYVQFQTGNNNFTDGKGVLNYTKNGGNDSTILTLQDGTRFAASDRGGSGSGGISKVVAQNGLININDSTAELGGFLLHNTVIEGRNDVLLLDSLALFETGSYDADNTGNLFGSATRSGFSNINDTVSLSAHAHIEDSLSEVEIKATRILSNTSLNTHYIQVKPDSVLIGSTVGNIPQPTRVVIENADTLLTPPAMIWVADGNTLKKYPYAASSGGTVTSFSKTDNYAIISSVTNPTTTPNHAIAVDSAALSLKYLRIVDTANIRLRPIAGTNVTITGTYPNLTFNSSSGSSGIGAVYAGTGLTNKNDSTIAADTGRNVTQLITGGSFKKVVDSLNTFKADKSIQIIAGTFMSGGGDLSANRTINADTAGHKATSSNTGFLSNIDWVTFNTKQTALSGTGYIKFAGTTPSYLTPTQVTADLDVFTTPLKGLVPAPITSNTTDFLRRDGSWATPPGTGGGTVNSGSITWPGTIYTTPTTGVVTSGNLNFAPALASQIAYGLLINNTGSPAVPSFITNPYISAIRRVAGSTSVEANINGTWTAQSFLDSIGSGFNWLTTGNPAINPVTNFLGTLGNNSLRFRSNNTEGMVLDSNQRIGIGVTLPSTKLHVVTNGLASTQTATSGLVLENQTASTSGVTAQISPFLSFRGTFWNGSATTPTIFRFTPSNVRTLQIAYSTDNSSFTLLGTWDNAGNYTIPGVSTAAQFVGATAQFNNNSWVVQGFGQQISGAATGVLPTAQIELRTSNKALVLPRLTTASKLKITGTIQNGTLTAGGSGYANGTFSNTVMSGGSGTGQTANITVASGIVTAVSNLTYGSGSGYKDGDVITGAVGLTGGSGFQFTVATVTGDTSRGAVVYDTTINTLSSFNKVNWTNGFYSSAAGTLTLEHGSDYVFTGTTSTWTLPAINTTLLGRSNIIKIKNRGSGTITLNAASGSTIYSTSAVSTINIIAGAAAELMPDGTYFLVMHNQ